MSIHLLKPSREKIYSEARSERALSIGKLGNREVKLIAFDKTTGEFVNLSELELGQEQLEKIQNLWGIYSEAYELEAMQIDYIDQDGPFNEKKSCSSKDNNILLQDNLQERFETLSHSGEQISNKKKKVIDVWRAITEEITSIFLKKHIPFENIQVSDNEEYFLVPTEVVSHDDEEKNGNWSFGAMAASAVQSLGAWSSYLPWANSSSAEQDE